MTTRLSVSILVPGWDVRKEQWYRECHSSQVTLGPSNTHHAAKTDPGDTPVHQILHLKCQNENTPSNKHREISFTAGISVKKRTDPNVCKKSYQLRRST